MLKNSKASGSLIINVNGSSTSGKSTITEVAGSLYGSPELSNNGIVRSFNATKNAIIAACEGRKGLPILLDDITANSEEHNKTELVYQLASNEPRGRCHNTGTLQEQRSGWSGLVVITSESPMFDNENVTQGINARLIQLADIPWTQSSEHSERIKEGVRVNYGHFGLEFAKVVQNIGEAEILKLHTEAKKYIVSKFKEKDELADRLALKFASIKITADLLKEYFFEDFDAQEAVNYMIKAYDDTMKVRSLEENALEDFKNFIRTNIKHFDVHTENYVKSHQGDLYGAIILKKKDQSVNVLKPAFKEFLKENKIIEQRRIQKYWAKHGYIKVEAKHGYDVKVSVLSARATKLIIQPEELEFYLEGMYEFDGHNITKLLEMIFGRTIGTQIDIPCIGNEYEEFDEGLSIEEIFETEENTDEN